MPRERFKVILRFLRFDNTQTRFERVKLDKLAPIRLVFDEVVASLRNSYFPNRFLTIDEHMCRYRGRCSFRQYMPMKPDRYGIKMFIVGDALNYYPINIEVYLGKGLKSNSPEDIVSRLVLHLKPGHTIIGDNYFTSMRLSDRLFNERGISYLGTIKKMRREVPKFLRKVKGVPIHNSLFLFSGKHTMVSYVTRKNKNVLLLSNIHHNKDISDTI